MLFPVAPVPCPPTLSMAAAARIRFSTLLPPIPGLFVNLPEAFAQAPRATAQGPPQQHAAMPRMPKVSSLLFDIEVCVVIVSSIVSLRAPAILQCCPACT